MDYIPVIISSILSFALGLIAKIFYDRFPFFSKKNIHKRIRRECAKIYAYHSQIKAISQNSVFYIVNLEVTTDNEAKECCRLSYSSVNPNDIDVSNKCLVTIENIGFQPSQISYFVYERYNYIATNKFEYSLLEKDTKVTLVFNLLERPKKIEMRYEDVILSYDISNSISDYILPEIRSAKKSKIRSRNKFIKTSG